MLQYDLLWQVMLSGFISKKNPLVMLLFVAHQFGESSIGHSNAEKGPKQTPNSKHSGIWGELRSKSGSELCGWGSFSMEKSERLGEVLSEEVFVSRYFFLKKNITYILWFLLRTVCPREHSTGLEFRRPGSSHSSATGWVSWGQITSCLHGSVSPSLQWV